MIIDTSPGPRQIYTLNDILKALGVGPKDARTIIEEEEELERLRREEEEEERKRRERQGMDFDVTEAIKDAEDWERGDGDLGGGAGAVGGKGFPEWFGWDPKVEGSSFQRDDSPFGWAPPKWAEGIGGVVAALLGAGVPGTLLSKLTGAAFNATRDKNFEAKESIRAAIYGLKERGMTESVRDPVTGTWSVREVIEDAGRNIDNATEIWADLEAEIKDIKDMRVQAGAYMMLSNMQLGGDAFPKDPETGKRGAVQMGLSGTYGTGVKTEMPGRVDPYFGRTYQPEEWQSYSGAADDRARHAAMIEREGVVRGSMTREQQRAIDFPIDLHSAYDLTDPATNATNAARNLEAAQIDFTSSRDVWAQEAQPTIHDAPVDSTIDFGSEDWENYQPFQEGGEVQPEIDFDFSEPIIRTQRKEPDVDFDFRYNEPTSQKTFGDLVAAVKAALTGKKEVPQLLKDEAEADRKERRKISEFLGLPPDEVLGAPDRPGRDLPDTGGFLSAVPTDVKVSELPAIMDEPGDVSTKAGRSAFMEFLHDLFMGDPEKNTPLPLGDEFISIKKQIEQREAVDSTTGRDPLDTVGEEAVKDDSIIYKEDVGEKEALQSLEEQAKAEADYQRNLEKEAQESLLQEEADYKPTVEEVMEEFDLTREEAIAFMRSKAFMAMLPSRPIFRQNKALGGPIEQPTLVNEPGAAPPSERADDVPMNLDKGDFVLPAKTVELTGIEDINTKLEKATKSAVNNGEQLSQETIGKTGTIPVNVHNGEIIVPEQLVPHIGKETLEKMKDRGLEAQREEEQQEQREQQQNPLGQQQNPLGNPGDAGVAQMGQAIGLAEGGTLKELYNKLFGSKKREPREGHYNPQSGESDPDIMREVEDERTRFEMQSQIGYKNYLLKEFAKETEQKITEAERNKAPKEHILHLTNLLEKIIKRSQDREKAFEEFKKEPIRYREEDLNLQYGGSVPGSDYNPEQDFWGESGPVEDVENSAADTAPFSQALAAHSNISSDRIPERKPEAPQQTQVHIPELKPPILKQGREGLELSSDYFTQNNQRKAVENKRNSELGRILVRRIIEREGSGINPNDPGTSKFGVTGKALADTFHVPGMADEEQPDGELWKNLVPKVTPKLAEEFLLSEFFYEYNIDKLPDKVIENVFDFAVNAGPQRAGTALQEAINTFLPPEEHIDTIKGIIGSRTLAALKGLELKGLLNEVNEQVIANRMKWIEANSSGNYQKGLKNRVEGIPKQELHLSRLSRLLTQ